MFNEIHKCIEKSQLIIIFSEPRCGPIGAATISLPLPPCDVDMPQPLVDRRPSVSLLKWGSQKRNDAPTPTAARQGLTLFSIIFLYYVVSH